MLLKTLIALCALLALALLVPRGLPAPPPVANVNLSLTESGVAYRYPAEYYPLGLIDDDYDGPVDSVQIPSDEVLPILQVLLDGMYYDSPAYTYYKTGLLPEVYSMAGCHYPRFILLFRDEDGRVSNNFSVCFECGNVAFTNGTRYPKSDSYGMSEEGLVAFQRLQDKLFPAQKAIDKTPLSTN